MKGYQMRLSHWDQNKENFVKKALAEYKDKDCPSAAFNILRYHEKGVIQVKPEFSSQFEEMFSSFGPHRENALKYVLLRLAKLGALEWNGA
jgi:hypothetical protein